jgi:sec-independent protein translocase protein TatC
MATAIRPIRHEDRLSLVEHLDELRTRLFICLGIFAVVFAVCAWQNHALIRIVNKPLTGIQPSADTQSRLSQAGRDAVLQRQAFAQLGGALSTMAHTIPNLPAAQQQAIAKQLAAFDATVRQLPTRAPPRQPVTLGVGEPFSQTLTVAGYFALLISLPLLLYQIYAFVLPAFSSNERRVALPLMGMIPVLFIGGVLFCYYAVLPPALKFLQNFNSGNFDILVRASDFYRFELLMMAGMGLMFQIPVGLLALDRAGIINAGTLRKQWRYAIVIIAILAAILPGTDPVTTVLEMIPLIVLYGLSILMLTWFDRKDAAREHDLSASEEE